MYLINWSVSVKLLITELFARGNNQTFSKYKENSNFPQEFIIYQQPRAKKLLISSSPRNTFFYNLSWDQSECTNNTKSSHPTSLEYVPKVMSSYTVIKTSTKLKSKLIIKRRHWSQHIYYTHINRSFDTCIILKRMKIAKVILIFKAGDKCLFKNYPQRFLWN